MSRAYTAEELRQLFIDKVKLLIGYWDNRAGALSSRDKLEGLAFSIMNIFDGTSDFPTALNIVTAPHPDNEQFYIDEGENWIEKGMVINDCMLHEFIVRRDVSGQSSAAKDDKWE